MFLVENPHQGVVVNPLFVSVSIVVCFLFWSTSLLPTATIRLAPAAQVPVFPCVVGFQFTILTFLHTFLSVNMASYAKKRAAGLGWMVAHVTLSTAIALGTVVSLLGLLFSKS